MGRWYIKLKPVNEGDKIQFFSGWIKHRPEMPEVMRQILKRAGVGLGESTPIFTTDFAGLLAFDDKGMAQHTAQKIAELIPEFEGYLFVCQLLTYVPSNDDDIADGIGQAFSPD